MERQRKGDISREVALLLKVFDIFLVGQWAFPKIDGLARA
jgi:hypothetical protein